MSESRLSTVVGLVVGIQSAQSGPHVSGSLHSIQRMESLAFQTLTTLVKV